MREQVNVSAEDLKSLAALANVENDSWRTNLIIWD